MRALKLKAGALQFTMFVVVIIALLLAAFTILVHTHKAFRIRTDFVVGTVDVVNNTVDQMLINDPQSNKTQFLTNDQGYEINIHNDHWGLFNKLSVVSKLKNSTFKKIALVGGSQPEINKTALYLEEQNKPLVVVGKTHIQGDVYLPKQGVRTGNISGHSYYGSRLIYGSNKTSNTLPDINPNILKHLEGMTETVKSIAPEQFIDLGKDRIYQNSFYDPAKVIFSPMAIDLSRVSLTGHILVQSETKIVVDPTSQLTDVILMAPEVEIKLHSKGTFQILASRGITVGNDCTLSYPSALILIEDKQVNKQTQNTEDTPYIKLHKGAMVKGEIVYLGNSKNYRSQVFIDDGATVVGEVYCNKNVELLGSIYGSVYTSGFVAAQSGSVYQNHIYNGTIQVDKLPQEYVGLLFEDHIKKGIAKWLY
ncbi:hypothetical protein [Snuella lapsa]|uniref:Polymer-forming cytoskeletal protein n=1 Tax=Snuella lapsa TaxID=870481 RepID=A0ABP6WSH5_9FLAO